ncbi:MAG: hypothetical protein QXX20_02755 [Candidatus Thermoplasmatota archaeon]
MQRFHHATQAVSIIIGALMLTVIVVSAATAFAVFTSQKQKELLEAEYAKLKRDLEELKILSMSNPSYESTSQQLKSITFTIANLHADDSIITSLQINTNYIRHFVVQRYDTTQEEWQISSATGAFLLGGLYALDSTPTQNPYIFFDKNNDHTYSIGDIILDLDYDNNGIDAQPTYTDKGGLIAYDTMNEPYIFHDANDNKKYDSSNDDLIDKNPDNNGNLADPNDGDPGKQMFPEINQRFKIQSREQILINISNIQTDVYLTTPIYQNDAITFSLYTSLVKEFTKTFIPPTAIIKIDVESLPGGKSYYVLDGSASDHPGDGYIIKWNWNVTNISKQPPNNYQHFAGRKTQIDPNFGFNPTTYKYWVNLTVSDNYGMKGMTSFKLEP